MKRCPHCGLDAIPALSKMLSGSGTPIVCRHCAGASYVPSMSIGFHFAMEALLFCSLASAFVLWHWWPLAVYALALATWAWWLANRAHLVPVTTAVAERNRRNGWISLGLFVALLVVAAITAGP